MFKFLPSFLAEVVVILNNLVVVGIEPKEIIPLLIVLRVVFTAIQTYFVVSKEEVQCLNCGERCVLHAGLVPPENSFFCLDFNHF
jgi:hypothetical protein